MQTKITSTTIRRKVEVPAMIEYLRNRTSRNVALAGFHFTIALYFLVVTHNIGTTTIGSHDYIPVSGLLTLSLALCFIYAGSAKLYVRTTDKVLKLLIEEMFPDDAESSLLAHLSEVQKAQRNKQDDHDASTQPAI